MKSISDFLAPTDSPNRETPYTLNKQGFLIRIELHGGGDYKRVHEQLAKRGIQATISAPHEGTFKLMPTTFYYDGTYKEVTTSEVHTMVKEALNATLEPGEAPQDASILVAKTNGIVWSGLEKE